jgi:hypothetical protein
MAASIGLGGGKAVIGCTQGSAGSATIAQKRLSGDPGKKYENLQILRNVLITSNMRMKYGPWHGPCILESRLIKQSAS